MSKKPDGFQVRLVTQGSVLAANVAAGRVDPSRRPVQERDGRPGSSPGLLTYTTASANEGLKE